MKISIQTVVDHKTTIPMLSGFSSHQNVQMVIPGACTTCNGSSCCSCCGGVELSGSVTVAQA
ncbi:MAG TPA: hypothetical protein VGQ51_03955 [Puia sp.]|nr:hypothetical protein [Puia sp.]